MRAKILFLILRKTKTSTFSSREHIIFHIDAIVIVNKKLYLCTLIFYIVEWRSFEIKSCG